MILCCNTLLGLDSAWWMVIATVALVGVTWKLWTTTQKQLSEQNKMFALANRPALIVTRPQAGINAMTGKAHIVFVLENNGNTSATNVHVYAQNTLNGNPIEPHFEQDVREFISKDSAAVTMPLNEDADVLDKLADGLIPLSLHIKLRYDDLQGENHHLEYICTYDHRIRYFKIERMLQPVV
jgi:hypothetical protein